MFQSSEIVAISILHYFVWTFNQQTLKALKLNAVKLKKSIYKRHVLSYWTNMRVGHVKTLPFYLLGSTLDPKIRFNQSDISSVNCAVEIEFTVRQRFFESSWTTYLSEIELHHKLILRSKHFRVAL